jgi:predicted TIM-barrel fold metal-dependent hydrolase
MIIDSHVHLKHGDAAKTEYTPEAIVETMDAVGIGRSVVFAMSTTTCRSVEMAQEAAAKFPDRLIPYVYALPNYERPVIEELDAAVSRLGFRGIKIHVGECTLADYVVDPVIALAGRRGVPCLIDFGGRLDAVERIARAHPATRVIVAHLGRYLCADESLVERCIRVAEAHPSVYLDVSGVVLPQKIVEAVRRVGAQRVLWGTDGPHPKPDLVQFARAELDKVRDLPLSVQEKEAVLGGSTAALLGVPAS